MAFAYRVAKLKLFASIPATDAKPRNVSRNFMKIVVKNNKLIFSKVPETFINGENRISEEWTSTTMFNDYELDFEFNETIFKSNETLKIDIDWEIIEELIKHVFENIDVIQTKGASVLENLFQQVFGDEYLEKWKGYFKAGGIQLKKFRKMESNPFFGSFLEYEVYYFLESKIDYLIDPYHSYTVNFSNYNGLTIIGSSRNG